MLTWLSALFLAFLALTQIAFGWHPCCCGGVTLACCPGATFSENLHATVWVYTTGPTLLNQYTVLLSPDGSGTGWLGSLNPIPDCPTKTIGISVGCGPHPTTGVNSWILTVTCFVNGILNGTGVYYFDNDCSGDPVLAAQVFTVCFTIGSGPCSRIDVEVTP